MKIHITNIYNEFATSGISQQKTAKIARELGFREMSIFKYPAATDSDSELNTRLDGILSAVEHDDIVIIQSPSWNGLRYDLRFVQKLRAYSNVKIIMFVHDVVPLLFNSGQEMLQETIKIYNYADLIIASSQGMLDYLSEHGLTVKKQMTQQMWDYPIDYQLNRPTYNKTLFFTGDPTRFPFVRTWKGITPLSVYTYENISTEGLNLDIRGRKNELELLTDLSRGGYGLVWSSNQDTAQYYQLLQPYKVATFLAAGIPVIIQRGLSVEKIITDNGLGFVIDTLEEADAIVQSTTQEQYQSMISRIQEFNFLIREGWFTKKMLSDAIMMLLNNNNN
ncbi:MAG: sugar transferase [Lachnospiraceae bacterium]|nr:sugar transferase [Lachnospiraceae bacterium]